MDMTNNRHSEREMEKSTSSISGCLFPAPPNALWTAGQDATQVKGDPWCQHTSLPVPSTLFWLWFSYCCYIETHLKMWRHNNPLFSFVPEIWEQFISDPWCSAQPLPLRGSEGTRSGGLALLRLTIKWDLVGAVGWSQHLVFPWPQLPNCMVVGPKSKQDPMETAWLFMT